MVKNTGPALLINNHLQNDSAVQSDKIHLQTGGMSGERAGNVTVNTFS